MKRSEVKMGSLKPKEVSRDLPSVRVRIIKLKKEPSCLGEVDDGVQVAEEGEEVGDEVGVDFRSSSTEIWRR